MSTPQFTIFTPVAEIKKVYPNLSDEKIQQTIKNFKVYDLNGDGKLDFHEVNMMMEKLGQTKTRLELNDIIAEVDTGNKGYISMADFFRLVGGAGGLGATQLGRIYETSLGKLAAFHEEAIRKAAGPPAKSPEEIKAEKLDKKLKASQAKAKARSNASHN
eukprot:Phypoly_transcript_13655.p1 GENE.Phypoly_transcript_13655~~Phypoly_transcript_13655.p1  ORF type:complete len:160 (+),score=40.11 Phypoly_transcript_13655:511-990(+)